MPTYISILDGPDIKTFDTPPVFTEDERSTYFSMPKWAEDLLTTLREPHNKIGLALQVGYFKAANKFFLSNRFHKPDVEFVAQILGFNNLHFA